MKIDKIKTDNIPILDDIIYYIKKLGMECVLKDQEKVDQFETVKSRQNGDKYILCKDGNARFDMFTYEESLLKKMLIPDNIIEASLYDQNVIPSKYRKALVDIKSKQFIDNYVELNNYYRCLNGLPDIDDDGLTIDVSKYDVSRVVGVDFSKKLHELSIDEADIIYSLGIIDKLLEEYPTKKYLNHLGSRKISIYQARRADRFELLYVPEGTVPVEISNKFKSKFSQNRSFTLKTIYLDAYKFDSDYYDNFIAILIIIQTIIDMIVELPDHIIRREIFDYRMAQLIFESNGIDYFPEIPLRYQRAMINNLNSLTKFKSSTKNIIDICNLFGFNNIKVFKYYLLKDRKIENGKYVFKYKEIKDSDGNIIKIEDKVNEYDLKFIKTPIEENLDSSLYDNTRIMDYDDVVLGDKYWNGTEPHDVIKQRIIETEFNYLQTKYFSIDSIYDLTRVAFDVCYFFNTIFDNSEFENLILLKVPYINSNASFRIVDLICYLLSLGYEYRDIEDSIMDTRGKILHVTGFNFKADLQHLANYFEDKGYTLKDLGISEFQIPTATMSFNQLLNVFTKNKQIYDHVVYQLINANDKRTYDIYKKIFDSLMITELNMNVFKDKNNNIYKTYTDFLRDRDSILYYNILDIRKITNTNIKKQTISDHIDSIVYSLEEMVNDKELYANIFAYIPTVSAESIKYYIFKVIDFFKSFKIQIMNINIIYMFSKLDTMIKIIDGIDITPFFEKRDVMQYINEKLLKVNMTKQEKNMLTEKIYFYITQWRDLFFSEDFHKKDKIFNTSKLTYKQKRLYDDKIKIISKTYI